MIKVNKKRIMIVDDHMIIREGLKLIFETEENYKVAGEAESGKQALVLIEQIKPDLILMDLLMPEMSGIEVIKALNERNNPIPIIILTTYKDDNLILEALSLGAKGYLLKDTTREELIRTIESAINGTVLLQPEISMSVFRSKKKPDRSADSSTILMTERESDILQAIAKGCPSKVIAYDLGISERTVKAHLTNIYSKLKVDSRSAAVAVAIEQGIIHIEN
jgi:NarL family two-component system response regulator YdfI